jgi:hypothetical protein
LTGILYSSAGVALSATDGVQDYGRQEGISCLLPTDVDESKASGTSILASTLILLQLGDNGVTTKLQASYRKMVSKE